MTEMNTPINAPKMQSKKVLLKVTVLLKLNPLFIIIVLIPLYNRIPIR